MMNLKGTWMIVLTGGDTNKRKLKKSAWIMLNNHKIVAPISPLAGTAFNIPQAEYAKRNFRIKYTSDYDFILWKYGSTLLNYMKIQNCFG